MVGSVHQAPGDMGSRLDTPGTGAARKDLSGQALSTDDAGFPKGAWVEQDFLGRLASKYTCRLFFCV